MEFKDRLTKLRHIRGLTQVELAQKAKITSRSVQNYELGARVPGKLIIEKLAYALDVTENAFFEDEEFSRIFALYEKDRARERLEENSERLVRDAEKLFNSNSLSLAEKSDVMHKIEEIYWTNRILYPDQKVGVMYAY